MPLPDPLPPDALWPPKVVARRLGISLRTLHRMRARCSFFPAPLRLSPRLLRWRPEAIEAFLTRVETDTDAEDAYTEACGEVAWDAS